MVRPILEVGLGITHEKEKETLPQWTKKAKTKTEIAGG